MALSQFTLHLSHNEHSLKMQIQDLTLQEEQGIFCKTSQELYFNMEDEQYDHSAFKSLAAAWVDEVVYEPEFKDVALEMAWEAYYNAHEEEIEEEGLGFRHILAFLKEQDRDDLQALYCCYDMGIASWSCILVINEDFEVRDLS
jgi:hypothetical protein